MDESEMDMVARVLKKYLKLDQRKFQMNSLLRVYGYETRRSVAEALGLGTLDNPVKASVEGSPNYSVDVEKVIIATMAVLQKEGHPLYGEHNLIGIEGRKV
ncbi:uncharacterized protein LOC107878048 [Capsicum annuum]|uniref:uncharacterized protein LOC107878048 n=1 Tax=Capsicum annuum TaxID=4072 RepID=UPI001FB17A61|nr:uncharacterized protein LOC107878048 [Capsicum annuum]